MAYLAWAVVLLASPIWAYNLDVDDPIVFSGPAGSEFGHSVSFHRSHGSSMLLVGAPTDSYSDPSWTAADRSGLNKTGVLYRCSWPTSLSTPTRCQQLRVDTTPPFDHGNVTEVKTNMRLGQSVISTGPDGTVMACASRWGKTVECYHFPTLRSRGPCYGNPKGTHLFNNIGKCIVLPADLNVNGNPNDFAPLDVTYPHTTAMLNYFRNLDEVSYVVEFGWAGWMGSSLGFSMSAAPEMKGPRFPLTQFQFNGPGFFYLTGIYVYADLKTGTPTNVMQQAVRTRPNAGSASSYSNVLGYFDATSVQKRALARPLQYYYTPIDCTTAKNDCTGPAKRGHVFIMKKDSGTPTPFHNFDDKYADSIYGIIESNQFAEGFGMSLLALDTDNDGLDELYIGAPYYMDFSRANEQYSFDFGAVYTYSRKLRTFLHGRQPEKTNRYQYPRSVNQFFSGADASWYGQPASRFGFALASVGDINNDGFQDMAIGAPGEYVNGQPVGAVYIYTGSAGGLGTAAAQRIVPQDAGTRGFGYSLAYGWDIDSNGYSDVAIGAVHSSSAYIYRARAIITVDIWLRRVASFDATLRSCQVAGQQRACFQAEVCAEYSGTSQSVRAAISHTLAVNQEAFEMISTTAVSTSETTAQITLLKPNTSVCHTHRIYVKTDIPNLCLPYNISVSQWSLVKESSTVNEVYPVLAKTQPTISSNATSSMINLIPKQCPTCHAVLTTTVTAMGNVTSGQVSTSPVRVDIRNSGNLPACMIEVTIQAASRKEVISALNDAESFWECSDLGHTSIRCRPTARNRHFGALGPGATASLALTVLTDKTRYPFSANTFQVSARASTQSSTRDGVSSTAIPIFRKTRLGVTIGAGLDEFVTLRADLLNKNPVTTGRDLPFSLSATFQVRSTGPSMSTPTHIAIKYPVSLTDDRTLYYLTGVQASVTGVSCNSSSLVNAKKYQLPASMPSNVTLYPVTASKSPSHSPLVVHKECNGMYCRAAILCQVPPLAPNTVAQVRVQWRVYTSNIDSVLRGNGSATLMLPVSVNVEHTENATRYMATLTTSTASRSTGYSTPEASTTTKRNVGAVVGGAAGAVVFVILAAIILYLLGFFSSKKDQGDRKAVRVKSGVHWPIELEEADAIFVKDPLKSLAAATLDMN